MAQSTITAGSRQEISYLASFCQTTRRPCRRSMMSMLSIPRHSRQTRALVLAVFELHWTQKRLDQRCDPGLVLRFNNLLDNTQAAQCHQGPSTFRGPCKLEPEILCRSHDHHPRNIPDRQAPKQQDADPLLLPQDPGLLPTHQGLLHLQQDPDPLQQCQRGRLRFTPSSGLFSFGAEEPRHSGEPPERRALHQDAAPRRRPQLRTPSPPGQPARPRAIQLFTESVPRSHPAVPLKKKMKDNKLP